MYNIERIKREFNNALILAGVSPTEDIFINGRLKTTHGRVIESVNHYTGEYTPTRVEFAKVLIENTVDEDMHQVILHEAAHWIVGAKTRQNHGHDALFRQTCSQIGCKFNTARGNVERVEGYVEPTETYKYEIYCPTCDKIIDKYKRKCKTIEYISLCTCKACGKGGLKVLQH